MPFLITQYCLRSMSQTLDREEEDIFLFIQTNNSRFDLCNILDFLIYVSNPGAIPGSASRTNVAYIDYV